MALPRGFRRGRALRRPRTLHPVSPPVSHSMCTHILVGLRRMKEHPQHQSINQSINCRKPRSKWAVRFFCTKFTTLGHILRLPKCTVKVGALAIYLVFDLVTNREQEKYLSFVVPRVPMPFGGSLRHPLTCVSTQILPNGILCQACWYPASTKFNKSARLLFRSSCGWLSY